MIQINPIVANNIYKKDCIRQHTPPPLCEKPCSDVVSFSGKNKKDLLELPEKEVIKKINESINAKNFLGEGIDAKVYKIPDTKYCVRLIKEQSDNTDIHAFFSLMSKIANGKEEKCKDLAKSLSFNLTEQDRINHVVAKLSDGGSVMKFIEGDNCFKYENKKELCYLPLESYQKLYKQVVHAKNHNMIFDCAGGNIIYNPETQSLTAIDFYEMDKDYPENVKPLSFIFSALSPQEQDINSLKHLTGLLLLTGLNDFEPNKKLSSLNFQDYDFNDLLYRFECKYESDMPSQYNLLKTAIVDAQCLKLKQASGNDVTADLNGKLKYCKALINQLFLDNKNNLKGNYLYFYSNPF